MIQRTLTQQYIYDLKSIVFFFRLPEYELVCEGDECIFQGEGSYSMKGTITVFTLTFQRFPNSILSLSKAQSVNLKLVKVLQDKDCLCLNMKVPSNVQVMIGTKLCSVRFYSSLLENT